MWLMNNIFQIYEFSAREVTFKKIQLCFLLHMQMKFKLPYLTAHIKELSVHFCVLVVVLDSILNICHCMADINAGVTKICTNLGVGYNTAII